MPCFKCKLVSEPQMEGWYINLSHQSRARSEYKIPQQARKCELQTLICFQGLSIWEVHLALNRNKWASIHLAFCHFPSLIWPSMAIAALPFFLSCCSPVPSPSCYHTAVMQHCYCLKPKRTHSQSHWITSSPEPQKHCCCCCQLCSSPFPHAVICKHWLEATEIQEGVI